MRSQFGEDEYIIQKFFPHQRDGTYFEAGAMDGWLFSNTIRLAKRGFTGILVEPNPDEFVKLRRNRPDDVLHQCTIGPAGTDTLSLNIIPSMSSTTFGNQFAGFTTRTVKVNRKPLTDILDGVDKIDFFSLDVEGAELSVLKTMKWDVPVMVWLIENHEGNADFDAIRDLMKRRGYKFVERVHFNDVFVHPRFAYDPTVRYTYKNHSIDGITSFATPLALLVVMILIMSN